MVETQPMHLALACLFIIVARICDVSMGTLRVAFIARGRKYLAAACGFFEVLIWITVVSRVLSGDKQLATYSAFAVGFRRTSWSASTTLLMLVSFRSSPHAAAHNASDAS